MDIVKLKNGFQFTQSIQEGSVDPRTGRKRNPTLTVSVIAGDKTYPILSGITAANLIHLEELLVQGILEGAKKKLAAMGDTSVAAREKVIGRFSADEVQGAPVAKVSKPRGKAVTAKSTESAEPSLADILRKLDARMAQIEGRLDSQE